MCIYVKYICLTFNWQKAKTISLKVFKIIDSNNLQQKTSKGTLRL